MMSITIPRQIYTIAVLHCSIVLTGCVPLMGHYYSPSMPGGTVSQHDCNGRAGEMTNVEFERGNVKILVIPNFSSASLQTLSVQIRLHTDDSMFAQWSDIEAIDNAGNRIPMELKSIHAHNTAAPITHSSNNDLVSGNKFNGQDYNLYEVGTQISGDLPDKFVFVIPSMTIDGIEYPTTKITFTKRFGMWIQFFNC